MAKTTASTTAVRILRTLRLLLRTTHGLTIHELVAQSGGRDAKTIRRDLIAIRQSGFTLIETVEDYGRKRFSVVA